MRPPLLLLMLSFAFSQVPCFAQQKPKPLSYEEVLQLKKIGYGDEDILAELKRTGTRLTLKGEQLAALRRAGAGEQLLKALRAKAGSLLQRVVAWHGEGKPVGWILGQVVGQPRRARPPRALLPALRAGVPRVVVLALRGTPLSRKDLTALVTHKPPTEQVAQLAGYLGLGFELDMQVALALTREGVPGDWVARLRRLPRRGGSRPDGARHRLHHNISQLYRLRIPPGWQQVHHSRANYCRTLFTPHEGVDPGDEVASGVRISYQFFGPRSAVLGLPLQTLGQRMVRITLQEYLELKEVPNRRSVGKLAGLDVYWTGIGGRLSGTQVSGRIGVLRAGRLVYTMMAWAPAGDRTHAGVLGLLDLFEPTPPSTRALKRREEPLTTFEVTQRYRESVVMIKVASGTLSGNGSGFIVREDGYILTNQHVVWNEKAGKMHERVSVYWDDSLKRKPRRAKVLNVFHKRGAGYDRAGIDLALLKIEGRGYKPIPLSPIRSVTLGDPIMTMGYPVASVFSGVSLFVTKGLVTRINRLLDGRVNSLFIDAKITNGNSGGPCFDLMTGGVIGLNTWVAREGTRLTLKLYGYNGVIPIDLALDRFPQLLLYPPDAAARMGVPEHLELAHVFRAQGRHYAAQVEFERVLQLDPNNATAWIGLADCHWQAGRNPEAWEAVRKAGVFVTDRRGELSNLEYLARIRLSQNKPKACLQLAQRILALRPDYWAGHALRGRALARLGRRAEALQALARARAQLHDLLPDALLTSGQVAYELKDPEAARTFYDAARKAFPESLDAHLGYIHYFERTGKLSEADRLFAALSDRFGNDPAFCRYWGALKRRGGATKLAMMLYAKAFKLYKELHDRVPLAVCEALGSAALAQGELGVALTAYRYFLARDYRSARAAAAYAGLAELFSRLRTPPAGVAWAHLARARELNQKDPRSLRLLERVTRAPLPVASVVYLSGKRYPTGVLLELIKASGSTYQLDDAKARALVKQGLHPFVVSALRRAGGKKPPTSQPTRTPPKPTPGNVGIAVSDFKPYISGDKQELLANVVFENRNSYPVTHIRYLAEGKDQADKLVVKEVWRLTKTHLLPGEKKKLIVPLFNVKSHGRARLAKVKSVYIKILSVKRAK